MYLNKVLKKQASFLPMTTKFRTKYTKLIIPLKLSIIHDLNLNA